MPTVSLQAHFDGERIQLDEPYKIPINSRLMVVLLPDELEKERAEWFYAAAQSFNRGYGDDEVDYDDLVPMA